MVRCPRESSRESPDQRPVPESQGSGSDCSGYLPLVQSAMAVDGVTEQIQHQGPCLGEEREGRQDWEEERMEGGRERGVALRE